MTVSPSVPALRPWQGTAATASVLAVVGADRGRDESVLEWAGALAAEHAARLTVLCLWSLPPMWPWVALAGAGAAAEILELHQRDVIDWLNARVNPDGEARARVLRAGGGEPAARLLACELTRERYTVVVTSRRAVGRRGARRLSRARPHLTLVRL